MKERHGVLIELLYTSEAAVEMTDRRLVELLGTSRRNNARAGISGLLLFHRGSFLQVLEGEEADVTSLYRTIAGDSRHTGVRTVWTGPIAARAFADWTMAFRALGDVDPRLLEGYSDVLEHGFAGPFLAQNPTAAQSLLRSLAEVIQGADP